MKAYMRVLLILPALLISGCLGQGDVSADDNIDLGEFCGTSTNAECMVDNECTVSGCSSQVCQGVNEEPVITTCEYRECYDKEVYNVKCGCVNSKCQWRKQH